MSDSNTSLTNSYNESMSYDKNGNIISLYRNGELDSDSDVVEIDNLDYTYENNSNRLSIVHDNSLDPNGFKDDSDVDPFDQDADYDYDDNGNMTKDDNKGITSIVYNHLNLPTQINFGSTGGITYLYDATGKKVRKKVHVNNNTTDVITSYLDGFQYKNDIIQFFPTAEGYANRLNSVYDSGNFFQVPKGEPDLFSYVYNYTDHLGNIRLSYTKEKGTNVLKIVEENHYYPFGLKHNNYNSSKMLYAKEGTMEKQKPLPPYMAMSYNYKYNGKEYQDELGLNFYDYGFRNYDPAIGRWMNIDPLADKYFSKTPYMYCNNNTILYIDPNGMYFTASSRQYVNEYISDLNKDKNKNNIKISDLLKQIAGGGTERQINNWTNSINNLNEKNKGIDATLTEIDDLDKSSQVYKIGRFTDNYGLTTFINNTVVISLPTNGYYSDTLAHELKHAHQFETGELSISQTKEKESFLYDKNDEIEAYKIGNENYGINNLPKEYENLPNGPLNINNNQDIIKALNEPDLNKQKQAFQNIANKESSAFRINGQTYSKK